MQNNWQQQQPYGYGGQQQQQQPPYLSAQATGFPLQPMQTGFPGQQQQQQRPPMPSMPQGTGNYSFLNAPPPGNYGGRPAQQPSFGMAPQMTGFPGGGASGLMSQQTGFQPGLAAQPTGFGGLASQPTGYLASQPTGFAGLAPQQTGMLRAQPTGVHDPRLQTMMQSFMPSNMSQPFSTSGIPQFSATQAQPLTQTFNSLLQNPTVKTPKVPWVLSRQEKKDYDQIFRAWDTQGEGFITGEMAREVFGQSGLPQDVLLKIWNLSDVANRGKLNLPEFHVAMGLIYRALNGNDIPDQLPEELVPPSMRDIDSTVNFMRDLLKHDTTSRSSTSSPAYGSSPAPYAGASSKDAKVYKHDDTAPTSYKPASRHLDRKSVRYAGEDASAEIGDIRRELTNTSMMLDKNASERARRTAEDEELEQDIEDLKRRVRRLKDDLEYFGSGRQTEAKAEEQRKAERELLFLMHEKLPELERRQQRREEEKRMEERTDSRKRDQRNDRHGRFDARDDDRDDKSWLRGTFDRDRGSYGRDDRDDYDGDRYARDRDRSYDRRDSRDHDRRPRTPPAEREAPPAPPAPAASSTAAPPAPPPAPAAQPTKKMTPEERSAFIREQAQRRIQERLRALGVESAPEPTAVDNSVQERLDRERKEAEAKAASAESEQQAREEARRKRLEGAGGDSKPATPATPATAASGAPAAPPAPPTPLKSALKKPGAPPPAPAPRSGKTAPPAPAPRGQQPAPPPAEDPEEAALRRQEEAAERARIERRERLKKLQEEEEEERKKEEALLAARQQRSAGASPAAASPAPAAEAPPPPPPPAPPAPGGSFNPFIRKQGAAATASPAPAAGGFNPFFRPPPSAASASPAVSPPADATSAPPPPPPPPAPPAPAAAAPPAAPAPPPAPFAPARKASAPPSDEDWDVIQEKDQDESDSDDSDYAHSRDKRRGLASALFGGLTSPPGSRPGSAAPAAPPVPKAAPAALAKLGGGAPSGGGMSALLSSIQGGAALRKAQTVDKSVVASAGKVVGDTAPPAHINATPTPPSPPTPRAPAPPAVAEAEEDDLPSRTNRQSVDWYAGLAADQSHPAASFGESQSLAPTREEEEGGPGSPPAQDSTPDIEVSGAEGQAELDEFDMNTSMRVRTLYAYEGQRAVDLSFKEDTVLIAHPAKDADSPWWYGIVVDGGAKGWFPKDYVQELENVRVRALYAYSSGSPQDLPFEEGDELDIVDRSDPDWWRTEQAGVVFNVPASYLEIIG